MSFKNTNFYGLNVSKVLTDVANTKTSVTNLGLNEQDITKIYETAAEGGLSSDFQSLSNLDQYLQRSIVAYTKEVNSYDDILSFSADPNNKLRGNLEVESVLGGSALKYQYYDGTDQTIKIADISTSRTSSWSSPVPAPVATSPIQYGLDVDLLNGALTTPNLEIFKEVQEVIFPDSEIPTHKLKIITDGNINPSTGLEEPVYIFVMKNLPLIFEGEFFNVTVDIELFTKGFVSYRILYIDDPLLTLEFENVGGETFNSILRATDTLTRKKNIEIYHNPDNYRSITIEGAGITKLPTATLDTLDTLILPRNNITNFPDVGFFAPALTTLDLSSNNFTLSDDVSFSTLSDSVITRLPANLSELNLGNCFRGPVTADLVNGLSSIQILKLASTSNSLKLSGTVPEVPSGIKIFDIANNLFIDAVPSSLFAAINLSQLNLSGNEDLGSDQNSGANFPEFTSLVLESFDISDTRCLIPDLSNRTLLQSVNAKGLNRYSITQGNPVIFDVVSETYYFENCTSLEVINISSSDVKGPLPPAFVGNTKLRDVFLRDIRVTGTYDTGYALYKDMFVDCLDTLEVFQFSSKDLEDQEIHPECFKDCVALRVIEIDGLNQFFTGGLPSISGVLLLENLVFTNTNITGNIWPTITNQLNLSFINVSNNNLTGIIPAYANPNLQYLYLNNNAFTEFSAINTPSLIRLYLHFNEISGVFPDLSLLVNLSVLEANNNQFNGYTSGSLRTMTSLARLDLSVNNFGSTAINAIINDLYLNYQDSPRPGVIINLAGADNGSPGTATTLSQIAFLREQAGWSITTS